MMDVKLGKMDYKDVAVIIEDKLAELEKEYAASELPEELSKDFTDDLLLKIYRGKILGQI